MDYIYYVSFGIFRRGLLIGSFVVFDVDCGWTMFSQLCRARPRTRWDKIALRQLSADEQVYVSQRVGEAESSGDDTRCQLENCTFCDFRVCCQVTSPQKETEDLQSADSCFKVTENPAYGLSVKNWLEITDEESVDNPPSFVNETMEASSTGSRRNKDQNPTTNGLNLPTSVQKGTSQQDNDCDGDMISIKHSNVPAQSYNQTIMDSKHKRIESPNDRSKTDTHKPNDQKHSGLTWSVLKHRQLGGDISTENCDKSNSCVLEHSTSDKISYDSQLDSQEQQGGIDISKSKRNIKDRSFPLSFMKPIAKIADKKTDLLPQQQFSYAFKTDLSRQRPVQRGKFTTTTTREQPRRISNDILGGNNPLSAIAQIKTEESIQEWLARISESTNGICSEDIDENDKPVQRAPWSLNSESKNKEATRNKLRTETTNVLNKGLQEALEMSHGKLYPNLKVPNPNYESSDYQDTTPEEENTDTIGLLCNASKASPANIPMVVMQCSRLHSHIGSKPPFQQTSLPMGTLVTALYQESDWLYVQTPHGVEGFLIASNCVPIGTMNDPAHTSGRPWEPCDFPIEINVRRNCELGRQQGSYIPAKLPTNGNKQACPYVNTVKMKTNFYSDRYFSHTFKSKDSIKTAKTVTDILRNSPETKVSNQ